MNVARLYLWEYDVENQVLIFNDQFCKLLGLNSDNQTACTLPYQTYIEKYMHPDDIQSVNQEHIKVKSTNDPGYFSQYEYRLILPDSSIRHFMVRLRVEGEMDEKPFRYFGIMQDITDRKIALQESYEALNKVDSVKTEFLSFISHELRTPLNGIVGAVNLLKNQENSSAIKNLVEILDKSISNLEIFTDNASYFSKLSNNYKPELSEFNLKEPIQFAILENENAIMEKNLKIQLDFTENSKLVYADKDLMFKSLFNALHVLLFFSKKNNTIIIRVKNEPDHLTSVFENKDVVFPSNLLNKDIGINDLNTDQQIGLSFYIIKQIMELHEGSLKLFNSDTNGASILISLKK
jgi:signal transduction histidine kinase